MTPSHEILRTLIQLVTLALAVWIAFQGQVLTSHDGMPNQIDCGVTTEISRSDVCLIYAGLI